MPRVLAFSVHILTASGVLWGLLALMAAVRGDWTWMVWWLALALVVDAIDGPLARWLKVTERGKQLRHFVEFARSLATARTPIEAARLQLAFFEERMKTMLDQAEALRALSVDVVAGATELIREHMRKRPMTPWWR